MAPEETPRESRGRVVVLGNFDGVHLGHRALLADARTAADAVGGSVTVWSFAALPGERLSSPEERAARLREAGADEVIYEDFERVRGFSPRRFFDEILRGTLGASVCVCGFNYSFGKDGAGNAGLLLRFCRSAGIACRILPAVTVGDEIVSSSGIRKRLSSGDVSGAAALLGRPYELTGTVENGRHFGRTLGLPTVNQRIPDGICLPARGVYATYCTVGGRRIPSVTNIGCCPTVRRDGALTVETNLPDFDGTLYGVTLTVGFLARLREEKVFPSEEALSREIRKNRDEANAVFAAWSRNADPEQDRKG